MRLTDLEPRWFTFHGWASDSPFRIGMTFLCPYCREERLGVLFDQPIDPDGVAGSVAGFDYDPEGFGAHLNMLVWQRQGDTFETLTLRPSIDGSQVGHWHGFITNGEVQ
jgi:hypothetical protein